MGIIPKQTVANDRHDRAPSEHLVSAQSADIQTAKRSHPHASMLMRIAHVFILHARRIGLELLNLVVNNRLFFSLLGAFNRKLRIIESIFLVYPATRDYARAYVYDRRLPFVKWNPWPCGLFFQNGKIIIMFCISATDEDFLDKKNTKYLHHLAQKMEKLRNIIHAKQKTFAGILPGVLYANAIISEAPEADVTAKAVAQALEQVRIAEGLETNVPVIMLGGNGFIGRRVHALLAPERVFIVDIATERPEWSWPEHLHDTRVILVNVANRHALPQYFDRMWSGMVVVNEVFPEPSYDQLMEMRSRGITCYHITGVRARAYPSFPRAYAGGIPCCAAWDAPEIETIVRKL